MLEPFLAWHQSPTNESDAELTVEVDITVAVSINLVHHDVNLLLWKARKR